MRKNILRFDSFQVNENKYYIDTILDKINDSGIDSLDFYEKKVLENPDIIKKIMYQYNIKLNNINDMLGKFGLDSDDIYIDTTFFIDGEIGVGDYSDLEEKFHEILNILGDDNFINLGVFGKKIIKYNNSDYIVGRMEYSNEIIDIIKVYPISLNFIKDGRTELVFYDNKEDVVIELSRLEKEYCFYSQKDIDKYLNILSSFNLDDSIMNNVNKEIKKLKTK